ncbi:hypothetical protein TTHERM_00242060 (macronuclear) [Tetrahymena thermophila SB210]|uniref:Uncharacterized protein n=1 Tax=Tetrahymena thermophila (strain SB210) TaxID=312017 RepID=I7MIR6_TETTS|nr:hypothetical protein TTHERM_00242060 [Tetrahymena thermophila SB210]EAS04685.2 hypothetical protein TTHERM_00242060 [Tetrahymena thermophila SB210]|eukprot:XP_001024930.2 hypothetical protein TTHERM_00242060 [Tetrahymena thermophila SB210]
MSKIKLDFYNFRKLFHIVRYPYCIKEKTAQEASVDKHDSNKSEQLNHIEDDLTNVEI